MVYTKRRVETESDRYGGYASPLSAYARTQQQENNSYETPSYQTPEATNDNSYVAPNLYGSTNTGASSNSWTTTEVDDEHPSFEYESEYNPRENVIDESVNPFKVKTFEMQTIKPTAVTNFKVKLNTHGKILLSVYSAICVILIAFAIYNAVLISSLSVSNATQKEILASKQEVINVLENEYNYLGSDEGVSSRMATDNYFDGFEVATDANTITVYLGETENVPTYVAPSNWFDSVCEFLSELLN